MRCATDFMKSSMYRSPPVEPGIHPAVVFVYLLELGKKHCVKTMIGGIRIKHRIHRNQIRDVREPDTSQGIGRQKPRPPNIGRDGVGHLAYPAAQDIGMN